MTESMNQKQYIRKEKQKHFLILFFRYFLFVLFMTLWEISSRLQWIDSFIFSSPSQLFITFFHMIQEIDLLSHIRCTLFEIFISFLLVTFLSVVISLVLWSYPLLFSIFEPYFITLNSLPKSALAPLLIVWLGANQKTIIIAGISIALFGSIINLYTGFQKIDSDDLKLIRTLGGSRKDELLKVVIPSSIPYLFSNMKVNIGLCLVGVIIGEFIGAKKGLGYLIIYSSQVLKMSWMLVSIILLCMIAVTLYWFLNFLEKKLH